MHYIIFYAFHILLKLQFYPRVIYLGFLGYFISKMFLSPLFYVTSLHQQQSPITNWSTSNSLQLPMSIINYHNSASVNEISKVNIIYIIYMHACVLGHRMTAMN